MKLLDQQGDLVDERWQETTAATAVARRMVKVDSRNGDSIDTCVQQRSLARCP